MDIRKAFATDEKLEIEGVWFDLDETSSVKVARQGNKHYARLLTREWERNKRVLDLKNDSSDAKGEGILVDVMARTILLDWKGLELDGQSLPYSLENAKALLAIKDFRRVISEFSSDTEIFRVQAEEAALGNSPTASVGA